MFGRASISDYYRAVEKELHGQLLRESNETLLNTPAAELADKYVKQHGMPKIELELDKQKIEHQKYVKRIPAHLRDSIYRHSGDLDVECEKIVGTFPIKHNADISRIAEYDTSTISMSWSPKELELSPTHIQFTIEVKGYGFDYTGDENKVMNMAKQEKDRMLEWVQRVNTDIDQSEEAVTKQLIVAIEDRKKKLEADQGRVSSLNDKLSQL